MAKTPQRKVRMDDPLWRAALWLAKYEGRDASVVIREQVGDWIARQAARNPEVANNPVIRRYLAGDQADDVDEQQRGQLVLLERFGPLPRAS